MRRDDPRAKERDREVSRRVELVFDELRGAARFTKRFTKRPKRRAREGRRSARVAHTRRDERREVDARHRFVVTGRHDVEVARSIAEHDPRSGLTRRSRRERLETAHGRNGNGERPREALGDGNRTAHAGEAPRPGPDDDCLDVARSEPLRLEEFADEARQLPLLVSCGRASAAHDARSRERNGANSKRRIHCKDATLGWKRENGRRRSSGHFQGLITTVAKKKTVLRTLSYTLPMYDAFDDDDRGTSTRFQIVRCALDDIRERLDDLPQGPRRDELAVEALSCAEAAARLEASIGSTVEAREALVRRIVDLEIAVLELGRQPVVGSLALTEPPFAPPKPRGPAKATRARRSKAETTDGPRRAS